MNAMNDDTPDSRTPPAPQAPQPPPAAQPGADESSAVKQLTPEEQMALFEQELKETDWGHQPC
jgi:hypothetical protein